MSKKTRDALRNARYNFAITLQDVSQCKQEVLDAEVALHGARAKLERAQGVKRLAEAVLANALVEYGPAWPDAGIARIDERDRDFAAEQARERDAPEPD